MFVLHELFLAPLCGVLGISTSKNLALLQYSQATSQFTYYILYFIAWFPRVEMPVEIEGMLKTVIPEGLIAYLLLFNLFKTE